ncbi:MAG: DUF3311 domain-containing protein [Candidatus Tyrphobacter sp.]
MAKARYLLLLLPFFAFLWPQYYDRLEPRLAGLPFFYWYQLLWVALTGLLVGFVFLGGRQRR